MQSHHEVVLTHFKMTSRGKSSPELPPPTPLPKTIYFGSRTFGLPYTYFAFFIYSIEEEEEEEWTVFLLCLRLVLALLKRWEKCEKFIQHAWNCRTSYQNYNLFLEIWMNISVNHSIALLWRIWKMRLMTLKKL